MPNVHRQSGLQQIRGGLPKQDLRVPNKDMAVFFAQVGGRGGVHEVLPVHISVMVRRHLPRGGAVREAFAAKGDSQEDIRRFVEAVLEAQD